MAYSDFTLKQIKARFELNIIDEPNLFYGLNELSISEDLQKTLNYNVPLAMAMGTEKAKSELIIANVLLDLKKMLNNQMSFFSGIALDIDKEQGLTGFCDFIISKSPEQLYLTAPIITLVEAKNDYLMGGLGQCIAEMVAAQQFNEQESVNLSHIYGVVTTGNLWKFLKLTHKDVKIDLQEYHISQIGKIMSILVNMVHEKV